MNPIVYIFLNKSLHMSIGKAAAQAAHAAMVVPDDNSWLDNPHRTIIVLEARDQAHLDNIGKYLEERGFATREIIDEGVNEIDPHVTTARCTKILDKDDENVKKTFSTFKLYCDPIKFTMEVDR